MNFLVDSSAWIEYFRGNEKFHFMEHLLRSNTVCTNDIILAELLPSMAYKKEYKWIELLKWVKKHPLNIDWQEICEIQLLNFKNGTSRIGILDIIIAQNCIQNDLRLIECDKHFETMAGYIPLKLFSSDRR